MGIEVDMESNQHIIRVAQYAERWCAGGIENFILTVDRDINVQNIKVDVLVAQKESNAYMEELQSYGISINAILKKNYSSPILRMLNNFELFYSTIIQKKYDVIHLNICQGVGFVYAYLAKRAGVKNVIVHSHSSDFGKGSRILKKLGHTLGKILFAKYTDEYIACSDRAAKWLFPKKVIDSGQVLLVPNGVNISKYEFNLHERTRWRQKHGFSDKKILMFVGRLAPEKNPMFVLEIFKEIYKKDRDTVLFMVGEGILKDKIQREVKKMNLPEDTAIIHGYSNQIPILLWGADALILPSSNEGYPIIGAEAIVAGLPCFFSDTITKDIAEENNVTFLSLNCGSQIWAECILEKFRKENSRETLQYRNTKYDSKIMTKKVIDLYRGMQN